MVVMVLMGFDGGGGGDEFWVWWWWYGWVFGLMVVVVVMGCGYDGDGGGDFCEDGGGLVYESDWDAII